MKEIKLTKGAFALVDDEDFEWLNTFSWHFGKRYAVRKEKGKSVFMHKQIMGASGIIDHINGNNLDNRKSNLRPATHAENMRNRKMQSNNTSGFRGVHKIKGGYWQAQIKINGIQKYLGIYRTPKEASVVYEKEAEIQYGEFRRK